jgi:hypothetical protein
MPEVIFSVSATTTGFPSERAGATREEGAGEEGEEGEHERDVSLDLDRSIQVCVRGGT